MTDPATPDPHTTEEQQFPPEILAAARVVATGGNPSWEGTYTHPVHGSLTFRGQLPRATKQLELSVAIDERLADLDGAAARPTTLLLAAALAGLSVGMLELPVVSEKRVDDEEKGSVRIEQIRYDPEEDASIAFLADVWTDFTIWRNQVLQAVAEVKGSSEPTSVAV